MKQLITHNFSAMATFTAKTNSSGANHVLEVNVMKPMYPITTVSTLGKCIFHTLFYSYSYAVSLCLESM